MPRVEYRIFDLPDKPRPIVINLDFSEVRMRHIFSDYRCYM